MDTKKNGTTAHDLGKKRPVTRPYPLRDHLAKHCFKAFVESSTDGLLVLGSDAAIEYANPACERFLGHTKSDMLHHRILEFVDPSGAGDLQSALSAITSGTVLQQPITIRSCDDTGESRDFEGTAANLLDNPSVRGIVIHFHDITAHKRMEAELAHRHKNLELLSASATRLLEPMKPQELFVYIAEQVHHLAGNAVVAVSEYAKTANQTILRGLKGPDRKIFLAASILGRDPLGISFTVAKGTCERMIKGKLDMIEGGLHELTFNQLPLPLCHRIEQDLDLGTIYAMSFSVAEDFLGTVAILTDRAEGLRNQQSIELLVNQAGLALRRQRAEAALIKADHDKNDFLATLAHELRNPLAPIAASTELLKIQFAEDVKTAAVDPAVTESIEIISRQTNNMKRLLEDLLDISRIIRGKIHLQKEQVSLGVILRQAADTASVQIEAMQHHFTLSAPEDIAVNGDPVRLEQIVVNLLHNAAKYTEPGGAIRLELEREGKQALIRVTDNGIGIEEDMLDRVFDLFSQGDTLAARTKGGLGIGLTLVKNLVRMHGGTIRAQSPGLGKGSIFTVRLPLLA